MTKLSEVKVLFHDYGPYSFMGPIMAREFNKVFYYSPWKGSLPRPERAMIGEGLDGVTNVDSFWSSLNELDPKRDLIVFFDVGEGDLQVSLRKQGYNVFGMGLAEELESNRHTFKKELKKMGLPVVPFEFIAGIDKLDKHLQTVEDKWVKVNKYRWLGETFPHVNHIHSKSRIDELSHVAQAYKQKIEFIVEDAIKDAIETGSDNLVSSKGYFDTCLYGFERKGKSYTAKVMDIEKLPKPVKQVLAKLIPYYKRTKPMGMFSTELRIDRDNKPWFIDATQRGGMPPTESIARNCKNFNAAIYAVATGDKIKLEWEAPYVSQIELKSPRAAKESIVVEFPDKVKENVFVQNACKLDGVIHYIPQEKWDIVGAATGIGKSKEASREMAEDTAKQIIADEIEYGAEWDEIDKEIAQAEKQGMGKF